MALPTTALCVERLQPVVPLLLMVCRLKPPTNEPQGILAALNRSPMFLPVKWPCEVVLEHTSPVGSISPINEKPPWPSATTLPPIAPVVCTQPAVEPPNMLANPGVDGPKVSVHALSLIA